MTDRELLEFAAKAAGIAAKFDDELGDMFIYGVRSPEMSRYWNPLTDDGDALRLAVQLRMLIEPARMMKGTFVEVHAYPSGRGDCAGVESLGVDDYAATRRAIVRAAAEIGRATP
jgi:hypothetical protein